MVKHGYTPEQYELARSILEGRRQELRQVTAEAWRDIRSKGGTVEMTASVMRQEFPKRAHETVPEEFPVTASGAQAMIQAAKDLFVELVNEMEACDGRITE